MSSLDRNITDVRIAAFPRASQGVMTPLDAMLTDPAAMWSDTEAARLRRTEPNKEDSDFATSQDRLYTLADGWDGGDGPRMQITMSGTSAGQGKETTSEKVAERHFVAPVIESTHNSDEWEKLTANLFRGRTKVGNVWHDRRIAMGFARETQAESRYLLGVRYSSGLDRPERGERADSLFRLRLVAEWGWAVERKTSGAKVGGIGEAIYGFTWSSAPPSSAAITIDGVSHTITWPAGIPSSGLWCPSPPFESSTTGTDNAFMTVRSSAGVSAPLYLEPDSDAPTATAGLTPFWFVNHSRI